MLVLCFVGEFYFPSITGSTVKLVIPVPALVGSGDVRAWKRSGRARTQRRAAWTRRESVEGDEGTVFAQVGREDVVA